MSVCIFSGTIDERLVEVPLADGRHLLCFDVRTDDGPINVVIEDGTLPVAPGDGPVVVVGRLRRRFFRAGGHTAARTEVVATHVIPERRRVAIRRALATALAPFEP